MKLEDPTDIRQLRDMARRGESASTIFRSLKARLGSQAHIVDILNGFRIAFGLSLAEAKPVAAFTRTDDREISDETGFNSLVMPEIEKHRREWDV